MKHVGTFTISQTADPGTGVPIVAGTYDVAYCRQADGAHAFNAIRQGGGGIQFIDFDRSSRRLTVAERQAFAKDLALMAAAELGRVRRPEENRPSVEARQ